MTNAKKGTKVRKEFSKFMRTLNGVFGPRLFTSNPLIDDLYVSISDLSYYDKSYDKANMHRDIQNLGSDFKKATEEASKKNN